MEAIRLMHFFSRDDHGGYDPEWLKGEFLKAKLKIENKMGDYRIIIDAVGGHGADRTAKEGEGVNFYEWGNTSPDAIAKQFVEVLRTFSQVNSAKLVHWPDTETEVVDDLLNSKRVKGEF